MSLTFRTSRGPAILPRSTLLRSTTNQDDTHLELLTESIAGTWDNNDPSPGAWTDDGSGDGGYSQAWSLDVATAGTVAAQSVTNQNSGQPDGYVGVMIPVYYEASGDATASPATVEVVVEVPAPTADDGVTRDVKFQTGPVDVTTDGQTVTLPTPVSSLNNAFVFIASNRHQGAGPVGSSTTQHADDMGVVAELTAVDTITFGNTTEATGPASSGSSWSTSARRAARTSSSSAVDTTSRFTSSANQTTALTTAPTDVNKVIPFIRGISSTHASAGANNLGARAWIVEHRQHAQRGVFPRGRHHDSRHHRSRVHRRQLVRRAHGVERRHERTGRSTGHSCKKRTATRAGRRSTSATGRPPRSCHGATRATTANEAIADGWPLWEPTPVVDHTDSMDVRQRPRRRRRRLRGARPATSTT